MGIHRGPNTVKDGLVFGYDTGYGVADNSTATRFYPGEATTNFVTTNLETLGTDGSGQSSVGTRTTIAPNHVKIVDISSNTRQSHLISNLTASATYTVSVQFKKLSGTPTFRFQLQGYNGGSYVNTIKFTTTAETGLLDIYGWQTAKWTFTLPSNANALRIWWQDGADYTTYTHSFELKNPQLEAKSHVTPYVSGTRSSTASLIDLKRTTNIDVSNVSFDSTGQPDFDGTNDFITLGDFDLRPGFTLEAVCFAHTSSFALWGQGPTIASRGLHIIATGGTRGFVFGMYGNDCDYRNYAPVTNAWHHWVFTYDGTTFQKKFIADGVAQTPVVLTAEDEWLEGESPLRLGTNYGSGTSYSKANGAIAVAKVYNRPLSDSEIINNYNAYKNRFDI